MPVLCACEGRERGMIVNNSIWCEGSRTSSVGIGHVEHDGTVENPRHIIRVTPIYSCIAN